MRLRGHYRLLKLVLIGRPIATGKMARTLLPKRLALPIFSSDAISSVAYATEATLVVLLAASISARTYLIPISIAIASLLAIVVASYRQTVQAYPNGGGAYVVAKENLGAPAGLVAAAALLIDYVLTVAVSIAAGVVAITSAAPSLRPHSVALSLFFLAVVAVANLRGVKEAGRLFALPTYAFIVVLAVAIAAGVAECVGTGCPRAQVVHPQPVGAAVGAIGILVVLRAFAAGCTALTGVEAIANGVPAFARPQARNAARTLTIMGTIAISLFLGVSYLALETHAQPGGTSVLSQVARAVFPATSAGGLLYYAVQAFTFAILVLAANTAFQGFPRLAALLARDRWAPRALTNLGDRLVYSNGVLALALCAGLLLWVSRANVNQLIHLYLLGVFTAFTLSQTGMVRHWWRLGHGVPERRWRPKLAMNAVGATATGFVTILVVVTKFTQGAWIVTVVGPLLVASFYAVRRHADRLVPRAEGPVGRDGRTRAATVLLVDDVDGATLEAREYLRLAGHPDFRPVHLGAGAEADALAFRWAALPPPRPQLELLPAGRNAQPLLAYARSLAPRAGSFVEVVVPEPSSDRWLSGGARRLSHSLARARLLSSERVVTTQLWARPAQPGRKAPGAATRISVLVIVLEVHDGTIAALDYARSLHAGELRALHLAVDPDLAAAARDDWQARTLPIPLEIVEAPFRDLAEPLLDQVRKARGDGEACVVVVLAEPVARGWSEELLHGQRQAYLRWLLHAEPGIVISTVPFVLARTRREDARESPSSGTALPAARAESSALLDPPTMA